MEGSGSGPSRAEPAALNVGADDDLPADVPSPRGQTSPPPRSTPSSDGRTLTRAVSLVNPVRFGIHSIQGRRNEMEDAHRAIVGVEGSSRPSSRQAQSSPSPDAASGEEALSESRGLRCGDAAAPASLGSLSYFAVFDGHGGSRAAEFCGERLSALLAAEGSRIKSDPVEALRRAFAHTEEEWLDLARREELMDGTTAAVALVDRMQKRCIVGNIGDSEVILGTRDASGNISFRTLTEVHNLKRSPSEERRITAVGGRVWKQRLAHPKISPRVISLALSRAIGDLIFKDEELTGGKASGLVAEPFITEAEVLAHDVAEQFLLLGCDGLWDTVTYLEATEFVFALLRKDADPQEISEGLVRLASERGSSDNITALAVLL